jgi:hypothetical protein
MNLLEFPKDVEYRWTPWKRKLFQQTSLTMNNALHLEQRSFPYSLYEALPGSHSTRGSGQCGNGLLFFVFGELRISKV